MDVIVQLGVFVVMLAIGLFAGRANERKHFRELAVNEKSLRDITTSSGRGAADAGTFRSGTLVVGSVVIAEDYFKRVAAGIKSLFGGNIRSYESLLERGRREAIVRMKQEARRLGATHIVNVRLETASLAEDWSTQRPMFSAEFIAYGTALSSGLRNDKARERRRARGLSQDGARPCWPALS